PVVSDVQSCGNLSSDITQLQQIASARSGELGSAQNLQVLAISNGEQLKSQLLTALQISLRIDRDYLTWAREQQSAGCGSYSSAYAEANNLDPQATSDKGTFLNTWDPIARQYSLMQFSADQI